MQKPDKTEGKLVLVTGAAGTIGRAVCRELTARGHRVRPFDRVRGEENGEWIVAELANDRELQAAARDADAVVHLAATPTDAGFPDELLPNNLAGVYNIFQAAQKAGVKRFVVTSSVQVVDNLARQGHTVQIADGTAPTNHYAATKVFAEQMGYMYAHRHNMSVIVVRPGWVPRRPPEKEPPQYMYDVYLSPHDAGRFFAACVESEKPAAPGYEILFALSRPHGTPMYDPEPAKRIIGYEPRDTWPKGLE